MYYSCGIMYIRGKQGVNFLFGVGIHTTASSISELNDLITTRMFSVWHDHATVASHSHLLSLASLIYDPLIYLTQQEYKG